MDAEDDYPITFGLALPPAWGPHERCWMAWPCRTELWRDRLLLAQTAFAEVARAVAEFEPVVMAAREDDAAAAHLACGPKVEIWPVPLDDSWSRDIAPLFVVEPGDPVGRRVAGVHWRFNAWGNKFRGFGADAAFGMQLLNWLGMRRFAPDMVLEGGSVATDGEGTLMAVETCLLNANRNPHLTRADIEERLVLYLSARRIVWLAEGLVGDDTDGHVDNVACFAEGHRVLLATPPRSDRENALRMAENYRRILEARSASGARFGVVPVPMPAPLQGDDGRPLMRSYLNFYIANGGLVVPAFEDPADDEAARLIGEAFPGRRVVQVCADPIVVGGGGIHCITAEQPAGVAFKEKGDVA